ncbi:phosphatases II [Nemania sp. FL0916]|nr:phosphatases II [Nemania sp. FL0916]
MASLLRQIVAGPRARHPEAGLDLCYVTDNIIATSGPSQTYPQRAYRNPLDRLVGFLDGRHGKNWAIWEFRAEGTGYPDALVYDRIRHYPWPDHHPPPFRLVPMILASMRSWLSGNDLDADVPDADADDHKSNLAAQVLDALKHRKNERVVVVHCKAGKGRSGTMACSYLIAECGWTPDEAIARFTERRMRPNFGPGVSIPSQLRWLSYVDRWTKGGKKYLERELEILEVHVWGLRNGVKIGVEGYVDQGKKIKLYHTFTRGERQVVEGNAPGGSGMLDMMYEMAGYGSSPTTQPQDAENTDTTKLADDSTETDTARASPADVDDQSSATATATTASKKNSLKNPPKLISRLSRSGSIRSRRSKGETSNSATGSPSPPSRDDPSEPEPGGMAVIFKPKAPIRIHNSDVNITLERRHRAPKTVGLTMVTAVAHVWFNTFFEGNGPEQDGVPDDNGVFHIDWDKLDGIKGSSQKGTRAADKIAVVWRSIVPEHDGPETLISQPHSGEPVPQMQAADWKGNNDEDPEKEKHLGLRVQSPDSAGNSRASSITERAASGLEQIGKEVDHDHDGIESSSRGRRNDVAGEEQSKQPGDTLGDKEPLKAYTEKLPDPEGGDT